MHLSSAFLGRFPRSGKTPVRLRTGPPHSDPRDQRTRNEGDTIKEDKFLISRKPYAVDLSSLRGNVGPDTGTYHGWVDAVWFRRRRGETVACIGTLWDLQDTEPTDAVQFLTQHEDGRYGGDCIGRWDGESYWGNVPLTVQEKHLAILRPMLGNYPSLPEGYDGWWTFQTRT